MQMRLLAMPAVLVLAACAFVAERTPESLGSLPTAAYQLEKPHASIVFRVKHLGLSGYTLRFADFDATLDFDAANPAASHVSAIINPMSVRSEHPTDADWDARIGRDLLKGETFPQIVFNSTGIEVTGEYTGKLTGDLTLMGVTRPISLDVTYNGGMANAVLYQGRSAVGFSARGTFKRSAFGSNQYSQFVGDDVSVEIEAEFTRK